MKKLPLFMSKEEKWAYMQNKGMKFIFIYQPLFRGFLTFYLIFIFLFFLHLLDNRYTITMQAARDAFLIVQIFSVGSSLIYSFINIIAWFYYKRKFHK